MSIGIRHSFLIMLNQIILLIISTRFSNAKILKYRNLLIIRMVKGIMEYLMDRIGDRAVWMRKLSSPIHPIIKELIEEKAKHSRK